MTCYWCLLLKYWPYWLKESQLGHAEQDVQRGHLRFFGAFFLLCQRLSRRHAVHFEYQRQDRQWMNLEHWCETTWPTCVSTICITCMIPVTIFGKCMQLYLWTAWTNHTKKFSARCLAESSIVCGLEDFCWVFCRAFCISANIFWCCSCTECSLCEYCSSSKPFNLTFIILCLTKRGPVHFFGETVLQLIRILYDFMSSCNWAVEKRRKFPRP